MKEIKFTREELITMFNKFEMHELNEMDILFDFIEKKSDLHELFKIQTSVLMELYHKMDDDDIDKFIICHVYPTPCDMIERCKELEKKEKKLLYFLVKNTLKKIIDGKFIRYNKRDLESLIKLSYILNEEEEVTIKITSPKEKQKIKTKINNDRR